MAPRPAVFLVFAGVPEDSNPVWVEAVYELELARRRLREIAEQKPGSYFICERGEHAAIDRIDAPLQPKRAKQARQRAA